MFVKTVTRTKTTAVDEKGQAELKSGVMNWRARAAKRRLKRRDEEPEASPANGAEDSMIELFARHVCPSCPLAGGKVFYGAGPCCPPRSTVVVTKPATVRTKVVAPATTIRGTKTKIVPATVTLLDYKKVPKWVNKIGPVPLYAATPVKAARAGPTSSIVIEATDFDHQMLPSGMPKTRVFGFGGDAVDGATNASIGYARGPIGPSILALPGQTLRIKWINNITGPHLFTVDPSIAHRVIDSGLNPQNEVPIVPHAHGIEVQSTSDGHPEAWFTGKGKQGETYSTDQKTEANAAVFTYPNEMPAGTGMYHDHTLGMTRLNVLAGLAGLFIIRDPTEVKYPSGKYEIALALQDRQFLKDGKIYLDDNGINEDVHPNWNPEYFGDVIVVNGKAWPQLDVARGTYRFRIADVANARFFDMSLSTTPLLPAADGPNPTPNKATGRVATGKRINFTVIGTEGGFLAQPVSVDRLLIAPGERYDILIDFSQWPAGSNLYLLNSANAPFPMGDPVTMDGTAQLVRFKVTSEKGLPMPSFVKSALTRAVSAPFPTYTNPVKRRILVLTESMGKNGPIGMFLNGMMYRGDVTEDPKVGTVEDWLLVNPTADAHPIHIHLVQHEVIERRVLDAERYVKDWFALNNVTMAPLAMDAKAKELDPELYYKEEGQGPFPYEKGYKDTTVVWPGQVTTLRLRFAARDKAGFPFDATKGPGYMWHCHVLDVSFAYLLFHLRSLALIRFDLAREHGHDATDETH